jgi:hypothetical protein
MICVTSELLGAYPRHALPLPVSFFRKKHQVLIMLFWEAYAGSLALIDVALQPLFPTLPTRRTRVTGKANLNPLEQVDLPGLSAPRRTGATQNLPDRA